MKKVALYIDTSVISFALSEDISENDRNITLKLIEEINKGRYEGYISDVVIRELGSTRDVVKREKLLKLVDNMELSLNSSSSGIGMRKKRKSIGKMSCRSVSRLKSTSISPAVNIGNVRM